MNTKLYPSLGKEDDTPIVCARVSLGLVIVHLIKKEVSSFYTPQKS